MPVLQRILPRLKLETQTFPFAAPRTHESRAPRASAVQAIKSRTAMKAHYGRLAAAGVGAARGGRRSRRPINTDGPARISAALMYSCRGQLDNTLQSKNCLCFRTHWAVGALTNKQNTVKGLCNVKLVQKVDITLQIKNCLYYRTNWVIGALANKQNTAKGLCTVALVQKVDYTVKQKTTERRGCGREEIREIRHTDSLSGGSEVLCLRADGKRKMRTDVGSTRFYVENIFVGVKRIKHNSATRRSRPRAPGHLERSGGEI
ncbi:hypothetical protein EVAR_50257_1 [Eumeta japonica]|uniref:Uncharacterized protein n=1 Tax=Eumeta variegata TaxID=151549 RepID=A0A4C1Y9Q9_EUMVA|nr:hypothetical protein EVAR_50257_1 [Eumeta japonica]